MNFAKFQRTSFLTEHLRWLLLYEIFNLPVDYISSVYVTKIQALVFQNEKGTRTNAVDPRHLTVKDTEQD